MSIKLLRLPAVKELSALGRSSIYARVRDGLLPPPVVIGLTRGERPAAIAWVSSELEAVLRARVAGVPDAAIRALVADLVARRKSAA
jgi:prophage regulatory protein